jgi:hypothetical protein
MRRQTTGWRALRFVRGAIAAVVLCGLTFVPAQATIVAPVDLPGLVAGASLVVYGRVVSTHAVVADSRTWTIVTLGMPAFLKGSGGREVSFAVPGGQIGRYRTIMVGAPEFEVGDEIVVFLAPTTNGALALVGFSQGLIRIVRDGDAATPMVLSPPFARDGQTQSLVRGGAVKRFVPLATLVEDVRTLAVRAPVDPTAREHRRGGVNQEGR